MPYLTNNFPPTQTNNISAEHKLCSWYKRHRCECQC